MLAGLARDRRDSTLGREMLVGNEPCAVIAELGQELGCAYAAGTE